MLWLLQCDRASYSLPKRSLVAEGSYEQHSVCPKDLVMRRIHDPVADSCNIYNLCDLVTWPDTLSPGGMALETCGLTVVPCTQRFSAVSLVVDL